MGGSQVHPLVDEWSFMQVLTKPSLLLFNYTLPARIVSTKQVALYFSKVSTHS